MTNLGGVGIHQVQSCVERRNHGSVEEPPGGLGEEHLVQGEVVAHLVEVV